MLVRKSTGCGWVWAGPCSADWLCSWAIPHRLWSVSLAMELRVEVPGDLPALCLWEPSASSHACPSSRRHAFPSRPPKVLTPNGGVAHSTFSDSCAPSCSCVPASCVGWDFCTAAACLPLLAGSSRSDPQTTLSRRVGALPSGSSVSGKEAVV